LNRSAAAISRVTPNLLAITSTSNAASGKLAGENGPTGGFGAAVPAIRVGHPNDLR